MPIYGNFKYGAETYGASTPSNLLWGLDIDWDDDGVFSGENEGEYLQKVDIDRGRNYLLSSGGGAFEPVKVGTCALVLSNHDGRFDPNNVSSPLYPNVSPGKLVRLRVRDGATTYAVFSGIIQDIEPSGFASVPTVTISVEDGLRLLQDNPAKTQVYRNTHAGAAISRMLDIVGWPSIWGSSLSNGMDLLPYWWSKNRSVYEEIRALVDSELGRFYCNASGTFVFQARNVASVSVATIDQAQLRKNVTLSMPWEIQKSAATVTGTRYAASTSTSVIWTYAGGLTLGIAETKTVTADFDNPFDNVISPVISVDWAANSNQYGTGTDISSSITITAFNPYGTGAQVTFENRSGVTAFITLFQLRGSAIVSSSFSGDYMVYSKHPKTIKLSLEWQQDANNPEVFAEQLLSLLNTAPALPTIEIEQRPSIQFGVDLFDPITLTMDRVTINNIFRVGSISHTWMRDTGQSVLTTIKTEPYWTYGYWLFDSNAILNTSLLGW